jgi:hypothetical protein
MELTTPTSVRSQGRDAFMWQAVISGVAHRIAWSSDDKKIRISWEDLFCAQAAVEDWVTHREATLKRRPAAG